VFIIGGSSTLLADNKNKSFKILFVVDKFPYASRYYINNQITGLIDMGHEVYILSRRKCEEHTDYPEVKKYDLLSKTFYSVEDSFFKKTTFDVLLCQFGGMGSYCLKFVAKKKLKGRLICCFFRGGDVTKNLVKDPSRYDSVFKKAHMIFPTCEYFKNNLIKAGCNKKKIIIHHSAIDCSKFKLYKRKKNHQQSTINIITVARFVDMKALDHSIRSVAKLVQYYPNIKYDIVGDGVLYSYLDDLIKQYDMQDKITLHGYLYHDDLVKKLNKADIFLLNSKTTHAGEADGIPNALLEAMATGLAVICTDHGGIPEAVTDGVNGFVVDEGNVDQLVDRLLYLITHDRLRFKMGRFGREYVLNEHNTLKANKRLVRIFRKALKFNLNKM
jgi:colanic acid/amylovoran biosynthesis glycosyltransferase